LAKSRAATTLANLLACPRFGRAWMGTIQIGPKPSGWSRRMPMRERCERGGVVSVGLVDARLTW
jgi:hypothetical protein